MINFRYPKGERDFHRLVLAHLYVCRSTIGQLYSHMLKFNKGATGYFARTQKTKSILDYLRQYFLQVNITY